MTERRCAECDEAATRAVTLYRREPAGAFVEVTVAVCADPDCRQLTYATVGLRKEAADEVRRLHTRHSSAYRARVRRAAQAIARGAA